MIKKFMDKLFPLKTEEIECAIDDVIIDCDKLEDEIIAFKQDALNYYTGVPAPVYLSDDKWFGSAPVRSQKQLDYMEKEMKMKRQERGKNFSVEPDNIHELMYEIATKSQSTTLHINFIGGSENVYK